MKMSHLYYTQRRLEDLRKQYELDPEVQQMLHAVERDFKDPEYSQYYTDNKITDLRVEYRNDHKITHLVETVAREYASPPLNPINFIHTEEDMQENERVGRKIPFRQCDPDTDCEASEGSII